MSRAAYPPAQPFPGLELLDIPGIGPEDVLPDGSSGVVFGLADGRVLRRAAGAEITVLAQTRGRPLGMEWLADGRLVVCDAMQGLLAVDPNRADQTAEVLCDHVDGQRLVFCNNPSVAPDGAIWFTTSSAHYGLDGVARDIVENTRSGQLIRLTPGGAPDVMMDGLGFANGVVFVPGPEGDRILVAATAEAAIHTLWLSGPRSGKREIFADHLPSMPDNLSLGTDGLIWVGCPSRAEQSLAVIHRLPRPIRWGIAQIASRMGAEARSFVGTMAFDPSGRMVHRFEATDPAFRSVTGVREEDGVVWMGSLDCPSIGRFPTPTSQRKG